MNECRILSKLLYTVSEVAELLSISRATVYRMMTAKELDSVPVRGSRRIPREALLRYAGLREDGDDSR